MSQDTLWSDLSTLTRRLDELKLRLDIIEKSTPADLITRIEGLSCALAVAERQVREHAADIAELKERIP